VWRCSNSPCGSASSLKNALASDPKRSVQSKNIIGARAMWHVVFAEAGQFPRSYAARSRDTAIQTACELLAEDCDVRRILDPNGGSIERAELDEHYDAGRFPGLPRRLQTSIAA
jgi:hypothetical protein